MGEQLKLVIKRKHIRHVMLSLGGVVLCLGFQNCGAGGFQAERLRVGRISMGSSILSAPEISLVMPIASLSNSRSLTVQIKVTTDPKLLVGSVRCQLDAQPATNCTSLQLNLVSLVDGDHTLKISATDSKGSIAQDKIYNFRIDATPPVVTITQAPANITGSTSAVIAFTATDALSSIQSLMCSRDGAAYATCASPVSLSGLASGSHIFRIRAYDSANNISPEVSASWAVDTSAAILTIQSQPNAFSNSKSASLSFSGTAGGLALASYECSEGGAAYSSCASPATYNNLSEGSHTFMVRGTSSAGTVSSPVQASWMVDTIPPSTPTFSSNITSPTTQTSASISFSSSDSGSMIASFQCSIDSGTFADCSSPKNLTGLMTGAHTFQVKALDNATNVSEVGIFKWTIQAEPVVYDGVALYNTNCLKCHGDLSNSQKYNRTAAQIQNAIGSVAPMSSLSFLTAPEVNSIAQALVKAGTGLANPFTCNGDTGVSVLRRLTKREYTSTILDLFAGQLSFSDIQNEVLNVPIEHANAIPSVRVFDSTNPNPMSLPLVKAYDDIGAKAADVITADANKMNAIGGACITATPVTNDCLNAFLDSFGMKALRRPPTSVEKVSLINLYNTGSSQADSMARVIEALLMAPQFLYKLETEGSAVGNRVDLFSVSGFEVASRLSYGILGSMPDQALFDAALSGSLNTAAGLQAQAERLFGLAKAKEGVRSFYSQWLRLDYIPDIQADASTANGLNLSTLKNESRQEIVDLMDHLIWNQNANFRDLMTTSLAVPSSQNLAQIYGVGISSQAVTLTDPNRAGILTRAGLLTMDATGGSNPIKRGVNVRVHLLCDPLGAPPANADALASPIDPLSTTRDQVTAKTSASSCMACHGRINPSGFAFENFDGFGRFRTLQTLNFNGASRTLPINATVNPNINSQSDPAVSSGAAMQLAMAESSKGQACMAKQWLQYNTGRDAEGNDGCALSTMYDAANKSGGSVLEMMKAYTKTPGFLLKKLGPLN